MVASAISKLVSEILFYAEAGAICFVAAETLSFGNSSSGRGSFERKNVKRRKQEFHTRKIKLNALESEKLDLDSLKNKVITSLDHLGEQKFSTEPGGYSFENWMKSFNLLLDDFEQRAGQNNLPKSYFEKRLELSASLFQTGSDLEDLEEQITKLQEEEQTIKRSLALSAAKTKAENERKERDERIRELDAESSNIQTELAELKKRIESRRRDAKASRGLFKRLVSGLSKAPDTTPLETLETRAEELGLRIQTNHRKISELKEKNDKNQIGLSDESNSKSSEKDMRSRLSEVDLEIERIESEREERQQLADKRKEVTTTLSQEISKIRSPNGEQKSNNSAQANAAPTSSSS